MLNYPKHSYTKDLISFWEKITENFWRIVKVFLTFFSTWLYPLFFPPSRWKNFPPLLRRKRPLSPIRPKNLRGSAVQPNETDGEGVECSIARHLKSRFGCNILKDSRRMTKFQVWTRPIWESQGSFATHDILVRLVLICVLPCLFLSIF